MGHWRAHGDPALFEAGMLMTGSRASKAARAFANNRWQEAVALYGPIGDRKNAPLRDRLKLALALEKCFEIERAGAIFRACSNHHLLIQDAHLAAGEFFVRQDQLAEAAARFGRALSVDRENAPAMSALEAIGIVREEDLDACCIAGALVGENNLGRSPSLPAMVAIGPILLRAMSFMRTAQWPRAEACFKTIIRLSPRFVPIIVQYGHSVREQGHNKAALAAYLRAILLCPRDPDPYLHLGHTYKAMGRYRSALGAYSTAFQLRPGLHDASIGMVAMERSLDSFDADRSDVKFALFNPTRTAMPQSVQRRPADLVPEDWLNRHQRAIFNRISHAISVQE